MRRPRGVQLRENKKHDRHIAGATNYTDEDERMYMEFSTADHTSHDNVDSEDTANGEDTPTDDKLMELEAEWVRGNCDDTSGLVAAGTGGGTKLRFCEEA